MIWVCNQTAPATRIETLLSCRRTVLASCSLRSIFTKQLRGSVFSFFNSNTEGWSPTGSTRHVAHQLASVPAPGDYEDGESDWQRKPKYSEKTWPSAALSTTNPTWPDRARTRAAAVGIRRLTAWAMAWPRSSVTFSDVVDISFNFFYPIIASYYPVS
jgi:hypothetical protein